MSAHAAKKPSIWVYNETTDTIIIGNDVNIARPIASLTKLMTAIIAIGQNPSMVQQLKLSRVTKSRLPLTHYSREDLFSAMLIRSDNAAAETLAANYPGGRKAFIKAMNTKAIALGNVQLGTILGKLKGTMDATTPKATCSVLHSTPRLTSRMSSTATNTPEPCGRATWWITTW